MTANFDAKLLNACGGSSQEVKSEITFTALLNPPSTPSGSTAVSATGGQLCFRPDFDQGDSCDNHALFDLLLTNEP